MTTPSAVKQRISHPILPPRRPIDRAEDRLTVVTSIDRKLFGCCVPYGMPKTSLYVDEMRKVIKIFPRKHVKYLQRDVFNMNNTVKYLIVFYCSPTMLIDTSRMYAKQVPGFYEVLKLRYKPWDIGEYRKNESLYHVN